MLVKPGGWGFMVCSFGPFVCLLRLWGLKAELQGYQDTVLLAWLVGSTRNCTSFPPMSTGTLTHPPTISARAGTYPTLSSSHGSLSSRGRCAADYLPSDANEYWVSSVLILTSLEWTFYCSESNDCRCLLSSCEPFIHVTVSASYLHFSLFSHSPNSILLADYVSCLHYYHAD